MKKPNEGMFHAPRRNLWLDTWRAFRRHRAAAVGLVLILTLVLLAFLAPIVTPYDFYLETPNLRRATPMTRFQPDEGMLKQCHWKNTFLEDPGCKIFIAGTDAYGRDLWSRTVYGARTSLAVAFAAALTSLLIGVIYGSLSGYLGGQVDEIMMRFVDFLYSIPVFLIVLGIQSFFHILFDYSEGILATLEAWNAKFGGLLFLFIALGAVNWVSTARLSRAMVHAQKQKDYVEAARALGANELQIMFRHLFPNIIGPLLVMETIAIPGYILLEATLSFVRLGAIETTRYRLGNVIAIGPSWGAMIRDGYPGLRTSPHLVLFPSMALTLLTLAFNFVGDGLRDAIDPKLRAQR